ncbi:MCE family protein [bacterium]|nr:MCE family protein [bacterium]
MKKKSLELKVGSLVLVAIVLFAYFSVKVGSIRMPWQSKGYQINVYFNDIAGLEEKAPVRLAGVRIGQVQKISLENGIAKIVAEIDPGIKIQADSKANVSQMGIMGEKYLEIIAGTPGVPFLKEGDRLQGAPPTSFDQVISVVNSIGNDIKAITTSFRQALGTKEGEERLVMIVENIQKITEELAELMRVNQQGLTSTIQNIEELSGDLKTLVSGNSDSFSKTLSNIEQFSGTLAEKAPGLVDRIDQLVAQINQILPSDNTDVENSFRNIQAATQDLKDSVSSIKNIMAKIEAGEGTIGKLVSEDETHDNLNAALTNLEDTLDEARNMLGRVGSYETSLGYRAEFLNRDDNWKHFISLKLQPRHDKYYLIEIVDSPEGYLTETSTHTFTTTTTFPSGRTYSTDVYKEEQKIEDQFLINLQIAKEFHSLTFRAGLIETHGGFGLDLNLFRRNLTFSLDSWDFGRESDSFHLKLSGRLKLYHGIYLFGGWDDIIYDLNNDSLDTSFIGAGVLFTDEDLKYLLGLAATASSM